MATDVFYGNVVLHNVKTRVWDLTYEYDSSDTDAMFSRYRLEFEGVIHFQQALANWSAGNMMVAPAYVWGGAGASAAQIYQQVRACLHEPRQLLVVQMNGETVLRALHVDQGTDQDCDVDNGPKPRKCELTHIANNTCFHVVFAIDVCKVECCVFNSESGTYLASVQPPNLVLSNRWGVTESMDANFFTTRSIRGRLRCSQAMQQNLHSLRPMVMPTLEAGFRRDSIEFAVLPNGLECDYSIVDRQVHTAAPEPATKMSATFVEANESMTNFYSEIRVKMEGSPEADKCQMMVRCVQVAAARLGDPNTWEPAQGTLIEQIMLEEEIGEENAVSFTARLRRTPDSTKAFIGNIPVAQGASTFGAPLQLPGNPANYDPAESPLPAAYGYTPGSDDPRDPADNTNPAIALYLAGCFLQSPCDDNHSVGLKGTGGGVQTGGPQPEFVMARVARPRPLSAEGQGDKGTRGQGDDGVRPRARLRPRDLTEGPLAQEESTPQETFVSLVTVSQLPLWQPAASSILAAQAPGTMYLFYRYESHYKFPRLRVGLPIAGDVTNLSANSTMFVSLGAPQAQREITVDAERVGAPPELPEPLDTYTDGAIVGTLLDHSVTPMPSTGGVDGVARIYRAQGRYLYGLNRAPLASETLLVGRLPFMATTNDTERFEPGNSYQPSLGPADGFTGILASE